MKSIRRSSWLILFAAQFSLLANADELPPAILSRLNECNVSWNVPGPTSSQSMPIGNGEIGLNVWAEPNGDVAFYIAKTDSWNDNNWWTSFDAYGLMKLGGVRISLNPRPHTNGLPFLQVLRLHEGEIQIQEGTGANAAFIRVWVDANNPAIRAEVIISNQPVSLNVSLINWRLNAANPDVIPAGQTDRIIWYHRNSSQAISNVANLTFGGLIKGAGLTNAGRTNLISSAAANSHLISIHPLTAQTATANQWLTQLNQQVAQTDALDLEQTRQAHLDWWDQFWQRSWVFLDGDRDATNVTSGYVLQRFITACAGRGAYPIKFNGSLFVVDDPSQSRSPDYRDWGGQYWFQNTRAMYWPRMASGDFDVLLPLFRMYLGQVPGNSAQVTSYYGHQGAYFMETAPFWGGLKYMGPEVPEDWTGHYFVPILELSMMMLDYLEFTGDPNFAQNTLLPVATAGIKFYDQHFPRDAQGKLLLDPVNSIEMFWKVHNPAPDIAGLRAVLPRMIALTNDFVPSVEKSNWTRLLAELPQLPIGTTTGKTILLPYSGPQTNQSHNAENPELYAIYPYRLYGVDKPELRIALNTFRSRRFTQKGCWVQDPIQAAMVGLSAVAKEYVTFNFTNKAANLKFPAFWAKMNDYAPDEDNGGCAEHALQQMLMQTDGKKILLLPAWPKEWNATFKLRAPYETTVQGRVVNGKVTNLVVAPPERLADIAVLAQQLPPTLSVSNILSASDVIVPLKRTTKGNTNTLAVNGDFGGANGTSELVRSILDRNLSTKYFNKAQDGGNPPGINTGFAVTPNAGPRVINGFQFGTANDQSSRDPFNITIEGSNDADAAQSGGNGFALLYEGSAGLDNDPGRVSWGQVIRVTNAVAYKTYRVLVSAISANNPDATQYSEIKLGTAFDTNRTAVITSTAIFGGNLILRGTNGLAGRSYSVLSSTNLTLPLPDWTADSSGLFENANGTFSNVVPLTSTDPVRFFRLKQL